MKRLSVIVMIFCMSISMVACGRMADIDRNETNVTETLAEKTEQNQNREVEKEVTEESQDDETESLEETEEERTETSESISDELIDGMKPEFKAAMDSYEEFFDEYIVFMEKYAESSDALSMLEDYLDYMEKYAETMKKLEEMEDEEMNEKEAAYYFEVMTRINKKLLDASL